MAFKVYNTTIDGKKQRLVRMKDIANEMSNMEEQVLSARNNLDEEYKYMWIGLKNSLLDMDINKLKDKKQLK